MFWGLISQVRVQLGHSMCSWNPSLLTEKLWVGGPSRLWVTTPGVGCMVRLCSSLSYSLGCAFLVLRRGVVLAQPALVFVFRGKCSLCSLVCPGEEVSAGLLHRYLEPETLFFLPFKFCCSRSLLLNGLSFKSKMLSISPKAYILTVLSSERIVGAHKGH